jgi:hypothetical protein
MTEKRKRMPPGKPDKESKTAIALRESLVVAALTNTSVEALANSEVLGHLKTLEDYILTGETAP